MAGPETATPSGEAPNNRELFYRTLIDTLLHREGARYNGDGHYYYCDLPPDDAFEGAWTTVSTTLSLGHKDRIGHELSEEQSRRFLEEGSACIDVSMQAMTRPALVWDYVLLRSIEDVSPNNLAFAHIVPDLVRFQSAQPADLEGAIIYDLNQAALVVDPFQKPPLSALYRYLRPGQAA